MQREAAANTGRSSRTQKFQAPRRSSPRMAVRSKVFDYVLPISVKGKTRFEVSMTSANTGKADRVRLRRRSGRSGVKRKASAGDGVDLVWASQRAVFNPALGATTTTRPYGMPPIIPSALSRPLCGTLRKAPSGSANVTKTYFFPNGLRGGTHRPFFQQTYQPSLCNCPPPPTIPHPQRAFSGGRRSGFGKFRNVSFHLFKIGLSGVFLSLTFLAAPVIYCERTFLLIAFDAAQCSYLHGVDQP